MRQTEIYQALWLMVIGGDLRTRDIQNDLSENEGATSDAHKCEKEI